MEKDFKNNFDFQSRGFSNPVDLIDTKIGFSITKKMLPEGYASMFKISINSKDLANDNKLKPISINASYGKLNDDGSITLLDASINRPVDFISREEFFYNPETNEFFEKDKKINGDDILKRAYNLHIKPTKQISGIPLRTKMLLKKVAAFIVKIIYYIFVSFLYLISGKKTPRSHIWFPEDKKIQANISNKQKEDIEKFKEQDKLTFLGYKGNFWAIIFFAMLHFFVFIIFWTFNYKPAVVISIFKNNFLTLIYVISSLAIIEFILPKILEFLIQKTSALFLQISFMPIKLKM